jgi:hypothetical protein
MIALTDGGIAFALGAGCRDCAVPLYPLIEECAETRKSAAYEVIHCPAAKFGAWRFLVFVQWRGESAVWVSLLPVEQVDVIVSMRGREGAV